MTGAQVLVDILEKEGVTRIFGYPGATICSFYDALADSKIKHILTRHEQGAAHAASGYARATGNIGVCAATSGPGATNLITGIATAYMDSIPLIAITGQVQSDMIGRDVFQEADITGASAPFCKHNYLVKDVKELPRIMKEAFHIARTGRPGPVLIDVPIDIQNDTLEYEYPEIVDIKGYKPTYKGNFMQIKKIAGQIASSKAPVICAGGGILNASAKDELEDMAVKLNIPVVTTLMGIGAIDTKSPYYLGMLGMHGSPVANYAVNHADLIIVMGARIADRAMAAARKLAAKAKIIHIDIDPAEIGKNVEAFIPVVGDVKNIINDLMTIAQKGNNEEWNGNIQNRLKEYQLKKESMIAEASRDESIHVRPWYFLYRLSEKIGDDTIITTEVGQNQIWAANNLKIGKSGRFITSGGMGTMGYGLPSAVGAKTGRPESI
ncbi:MAG: biosynthetic-type acetolactate synthase large subunit, partial [Candidatus Pacebacteria bacterium]|nr:biosynthetic-type acetolactate synthase large subunit [Candidatus Paceibacterota bacterium]